MTRYLESTRTRKQGGSTFPFVIWLLIGLAAVVALVQSFGIAIGQEAVPPIPEPTINEWAALIQSLGGVQGMGTLGLVGLGVQGLLLTFRSRFVNLTGPMKFLVVSGLTMVAGPVALVAGGMPWAAALAHSATLTAAQVFADQAKKQLIDKKKK